MHEMVIIQLIVADENNRWRGDLIHRRWPKPLASPAAVWTKPIHGSEIRVGWIITIAITWLSFHDGAGVLGARRLEIVGGRQSPHWNRH